MEKVQMDSFLLCTAHASRLTRLIPIFLVGVLITGCGNKMLPKPLSDEAPPQIGNLQVQVRAKGVELSWCVANLPEADSKNSGLRLSVQKAEIKWENRSCLDCPVPNQREVLNLDALHPQPAVLENQKYIWIDPDAALQHVYRYQVLLMDKKGNQLSASNIVMAKLVPAPPPPRDLHATTEPQGIILRWKTPGKDEHGRPLQGDLQFHVERHASGAAWEKASTVPVRGSTFMDPAVASAQSYDYRVIPVLLFEGTPVVGEPAVVRMVKTPDSLPPPPPKTVWIVPSKGSLEVQWTESDGKISGYHVYRREGKEITRLTSSPIQHPPYVDKSMKKNTVYHYAVSAVSTLGDQREGLLSKWIEIRSLSFE